ncbi:MAG TPA: hypothetical protein VMB47_11755 [Candidatus Aquilonibacter sp.]|nr:hypothetical protein [Candidatus Aquilonibacter sp.]
MTSLTTGWHALAGRFTLQNDFRREEWRFQSAITRYATHYNNCLTIGANPAGLYLSMPRLFGISHPNLFIAWSEITVSHTKFLFWDMVRLQLGRENSIPFTIRPKLAEGIRRAAGASWPKENLS